MERTVSNYFSRGNTGSSSFKNRKLKKKLVVLVNVSKFIHTFFVMCMFHKHFELFWIIFILMVKIRIRDEKPGCQENGNRSYKFVRKKMISFHSTKGFLKKDCVIWWVSQLTIMVQMWAFVPELKFNNMVIASGLSLQGVEIQGSLSFMQSSGSLTGNALLSSGNTHDL